MSLTIILWIIFPSNSNTYSLHHSLLLIFCCLRLSVFPVLIAGWSSNSSYASLGIIRALAQTISYEVRLAIIVICPLIICETLRFYDLKEIQDGINLGWWLWHSATILYISRIADVNRAPFDFIEGESELVSGFNVEYYGFGFAFIFLAEYAIIIWIRGLNSIIFFPFYAFIPSTLFYAYTIIWIRASLPRIRYDELIYLCWKIFLPVRIISLALTILLKYISTINI